MNTVIISVLIATATGIIAASIAIGINYLSASTPRPSWLTPRYLIAYILAAIAISAVLPFAFPVNSTEGSPSARSTGPVAPTIASTPTSIFTPPTSNVPPSADASTTAPPPSEPVVRHRGELTLVSGGGNADLDSPQSDRQWSGKDVDGWGDITQSGNYINFFTFTSALVSNGPANYTTCDGQTGYSNDPIPVDPSSAGMNICVKTDHGRYAAIKIIDVTTDRIRLDVVTYDPPA